jgi:hypothetical protein
VDRLNKETSSKTNQIGILLEMTGADGLIVCRSLHNKRVVANEGVETLVQYRYDDNGQLTEVINRNGDSMRRFSYAEGVMASHSNALGLSCHYHWETIDGQPRVVEHWTSDGEHFHFRR